MAGPRYGVDLRGAQPADAADIAELLGLLGPPVTPAQAAARLERLAQDSAAAALVATGWNGRAIGLVALHWGATLLAERPAAHVTALVVAAEDRRSGIGRLLLKAASQAARQAGCDSLDLALTPEADAARAFATALGFHGIGETLTRPLRKRSEPGR